MWDAMTYPPKELKLTEPTIPSVGEDEEQLKHSYIAVGSGTSSLGNRLVVFIKVKYTHLPYDTGIPLLDTYSVEMSAYYHQKNVQSSIIYSGPNWK